MNFAFSDDNKRFHTYNYYLKHRFGGRVIKIPLNVDLGCPNRDGTKGEGGCIFCSAKKSGEFAGNPCDDIITQYSFVKDNMYSKWQGARYIPYFQAGSNTYGDVEMLRQMFETALGLEAVVGLSIATRADCISEEIADMLAQLSDKTYLTVELGLQTVNDETARLCNRGHDYADFLAGFGLLKKRRINVCVHIINGLPFETHEMMLQTAREVAALGVHAVKIHSLHVLKGTALADMYQRGELDIMGIDEYISTVCDQLEILPAEIVIERITGDGDKSQMIAPKWSMNKLAVMNGIDMEMARRGTYQGFR